MSRMLRTGGLRSGLLALAVMMLLPASALATSSISQTGSLIVDGPAQVGQTLTCDDGQEGSQAGTLQWADANGYSVTDSWQYLGGGAVAGAPTTDGEGFDGPSSGPVPDDQYTVVQADLGKQIECVQTATDAVTSTDHVAVTSAATAAALPLPSLTVTQYSGAVSGAIGVPQAGVVVHLTLERTDASDSSSEDTIATATATTAGDGTWSASGLTPASGYSAGVAVFGSSGDVLRVSYSGTYGTTPVSFDHSFAAGQLVFDDDSQIAADGSSVSAPSAAYEAGANLPSGFTWSCNDLTYTITSNGTPTTVATSASGAAGCSYAASPALTGADAVTASLTLPMTTDVAGDVTDVTTSSAVPLLGVSSTREDVQNSQQAFGAGTPSCSYDYVQGELVCSGLNGDSFVVTQAGSSIPLGTLTAQGGADDYGLAALSGASAGATLDVTDTSVTPNRLVATLELVALREDLGDNVPPGAGGSALPANTFAPTDTVCLPGSPIVDQNYNTAACPVSGEDPGVTADQEYDASSGGYVWLNLPTLYSFWAQDTYLPAGSPLYLDSTEGSPAVGSVKVWFVPHGGTLSGSGTALSFGSDNDSYYYSGAFPSLSTGRYWADVQLTDDNGDTIWWSDSFIIAPADSGPQGANGAQGAAGSQGPQGAAGPAGPAGATGARGPAGRSAKVTCKARGTRVRCTVTYSRSASLRRAHWRLMRGASVIRHGSVRLVHGHARLSLALLRGAGPGTYTLMVSTRGRTVATRVLLRR